MSKYLKSESLLEESLKIIPLGSQTFSKSLTSIPFGVSPFFVKSAKGCRFTDVDGNEFIDFVSALCAVTLGYCDSEVDSAVIQQLGNGVTFSLSHPLEIQVAKQLVELIPSAEMVRFAKNGSDVTSAAIRVARHVTQRDHVAVCGYHGWHDWYVGSTSRSGGIPNCIKHLTHTFKYNNIASLEKILEDYKDQIAAVIIEPMNIEYPNDNFLQRVRDLTEAHNCLLIFDETITGFRFNLGGAQKLFGVTPDLSTFGKGIANGYPLSALVGKKKYMQTIEEIFFSGTFGGETLSLAAANAVINKLKNENILGTMESVGLRLISEVNRLILEKELSKVVEIKGHPTWSFLIFKDVNGYSSFQIKTYFLQEIFKKNIYTLGTHNINFAHKNSDIDILIEAYDQIFSELINLINNGNLIDSLECECISPLFKVR
jgi:glutamate-1-semialdehyde aminotransferase